MQTLIESLQQTLGQTLPNVVGAVIILVIGWIVALIIRAAVRKALGLLRLNHHLRTSTGSAMDVERGIAAGLYYLILLLVLIAFFNTLHLELVSTPLKTLAVLAVLVRTAIAKLLATTTLDERLSLGASMRPISESIGNALYWLIILLFLPAVLGALELQGLLGPVQAMVHKILAIVPNIVAAAIIGIAGWWIAKIVRELVSSLLATAGTDQVGARVGLQGTMTLSRLIGLVFYILILVPALIAALDALQIEAVTTPAKHMLDQLMSAIPNIFAAGIILGVAFLVARLVSNIVSALLGGMGFDRLPAALGLGRAFEGGPTPLTVRGKGNCVLRYALRNRGGRRTSGLHADLHPGVGVHQVRQ